MKTQDEIIMHITDALKEPVSSFDLAIQLIAAGKQLAALNNSTITPGEYTITLSNQDINEIITWGNSHLKILSQNKLNTDNIDLLQYYNTCLNKTDLKIKEFSQKLIN